MTDIPEAARRARQMYADGATIVAIRSATGLTHHMLYRWLEGGRDGALPPLTKRRQVKKARITPGDRVSVISRITRSAERQVAEIDKLIGSDASERDRDARTLASLARTIRELSAIDAMDREIEQAKSGKGSGKNEQSDQTVPRDVEGLRRSLARKLAGIVAKRDEPIPGDPQF